jgi:hypothetical protein
MGNITWTKSWSASDNGSVLGGADLQNIQNDITTVVNGGITNANVNASAAIVESKLSFSTSTGHTHDGSDSNYPLIKHYRKGCLIKTGTTATTDIKVTPGVIDVGGKLLVSTADSSDISVASGSNYADSGSEPADGAIYVYAYNNSGTLAFKLSTEPPDLADSDDNTAEFPLRYQKYNSTYYRLIGIAHNRSDLSLDMFNQFDISNYATGSFVGDGADETIYTGWTPDVIWTFVCSDTTPANAEAPQHIKIVQRYGFATANPQPQALCYDLLNNTHDTSANGTANTYYNLNAQTTSQAGSFTIDAPENGDVTMWMAWAHGMHG